MRKKLGILGSLVIVVATLLNFSLNRKSATNSKLDLGTLITNNNANAEVGLPCDVDPNDDCWNPETGQHYTDCDPSWWFHSCEG